MLKNFNTEYQLEILINAIIKTSDSSEPGKAEFCLN